MPTPQYIGDTDWTRQPGSVEGVKDGLYYIDVPFRGSLFKANAFRNNWRRGDACDLPGLAHLKLVENPEITDEAGGAASTILRFEGEDISGGSGGDDTDGIEEKWYAERRNMTWHQPAYIYPLGETIYVYNAKIHTATYTDDVRRTTTKVTPVLEDPDYVTTLKQPTFFIPFDQLQLGTDYVVETKSVLTSVVRRSSGAYVHTEWHERIFVAKSTGDV